MVKTRVTAILLAALTAFTAIPFMAAPVSAAANTMNVGDKIRFDVSKTDNWLNDSPNWDAGTNGQKITAVAASAAESYLDFTGVSNAGSAYVRFTLGGLNKNTTYNISVNAVLRAADTSKNKFRYEIFVAGSKVSNGSFTLSSTTADTGSVSTGENTTVDFLVCGNANPAYTSDFDLYSIAFTPTNGGSAVTYDFSTDNSNMSWILGNNAKAEVIRKAASPAHIAVGAIKNVSSGANTKRVYYKLDEDIILMPGIYKLSCALRPYTARITGFRFEILDGNMSVNGTSYARGTSVKELKMPTVTTGTWNNFSESFTVYEKTKLGAVSILGGTNSGDIGAYGVKDFAFECVSVTTEAIEKEAVVPNNLITDGNCNIGLPEGLTDHENYTLKWNSNGFASVEKRTVGNECVTYVTSITGGLDITHTYELSFRVRAKSANKPAVIRLNSTTNAAVVITDNYYSDVEFNAFRVSGEWQTVTMRVGPDINTSVIDNGQIALRIYGNKGLDNLGNGFEAIQLDSFTLIDLTDVNGVGYPNLITDGDCENGIPEGMKEQDKNIPIIYNQDGYVTVASRTVGNSAFVYTTNIPDGINPEHTYQLSFSIRSHTEGEKSVIRMYGPNGGDIAPIGGAAKDDAYNVIRVHDKWTVYTYEISPETNTCMFTGNQIGLKFNGYHQNYWYQNPKSVGFRSFDIDNLILIDLTPDEPYNNLIKNGSFNSADTEDNLKGWGDSESGEVVSSDVVDGSGVIVLNEVTGGGSHAKFEAEGIKLKEGHTYKLSFKIRTADKKGSSIVRLYTNLNGNAGSNGDTKEIAPVQNKELAEHVQHYITVDGKWRTYTFVIDNVENNVFYETSVFNLRFHGNNNSPVGFAKLYIDDIVLTDTTPEPPGRPYSGIVMMLMLKKKLANGESWRDDFVPTNIIEGADTSAALSRWDAGKQTLTSGSEDDISYLSASNITVNYAGFTYRSGVVLKPGTYVFSCKLRTSVNGETTNLRLVNTLNGAETNVKTNNSWSDASFTITVKEASEFVLKICGGTSPNDIQSYDIGSISLIDVNEKPTSSSRNDKEVNLVEGATSASALSSWNAGKQKLEAKIEKGTAYLAASGITVNYAGFTYNSGVTLEPGVYKISCELRTSVKGEKSNVRLYHLDTKTERAFGIDNDWTACTITIAVTAPTELSIKICGGTDPSYVQSYDIANMKVVKVG